MEQQRYLEGRLTIARFPNFPIQDIIGPLTKSLTTIVSHLKIYLRDD